MNSRFDTDGSPLLAASSPTLATKPAGQPKVIAPSARPQAQPSRVANPDRNSVDPLRSTDRYRLVMPLAHKL